MESSGFWVALDRLVAASHLVIDRPKGSLHPQYSSFQYPLDYGYLQGTHAPDGGGIDVWIGGLNSLSTAARTVTGIIATLDLEKRDAEIKLLLDCTDEDAKIALATHNRGLQRGILIERSDIRDNYSHD